MSGTSTVKLYSITLKCSLGYSLYLYFIDYLPLYKCLHQADLDALTHTSKSSMPQSCLEYWHGSVVSLHGAIKMSLHALCSSKKTEYWESEVSEVTTWLSCLHSNYWNKAPKSDVLSIRLSCYCTLISFGDLYHLHTCKGIYAFCYVYFLIFTYTYMKGRPFDQFWNIF